MILELLPYIGTFSDVRTATGLNKLELKDEQIDLNIYRAKLYAELQSTVPDGGESAYVQFETWKALPVEDEKPAAYYTVQMYSSYFVALAILQTVGLKAFKTQADGKSSISRFSPESAYMSALENVKAELGTIGAILDDQLGVVETTTPSLVSVSAPDIDLVTNT